MKSHLFALAALLAAPVPLAAGPYDNLAEVEVLPGWRMESGDHMAGLRITLKDGWKTYWRAPGDAGIPPQFSYAGSANITSITPQWPVPEVFDQGGQRSIGYHDSVVFPLTIAITDTAATTRLTGQIDIGVCEEICIPVTLTFDAALPATGQRDAAITAALIDRPLTGAEAAVGPVTCTIVPISDGLRVTTTMTADRPDPAEIVIIESGNDSVWVSQADVVRTGNQISAAVDMVHVSGDSFVLDRSRLRVTLLGPTRAVELQGCTAG